MATSTLANSPTPENPNQYDGHLIDQLINTVEQAEKPKPPQPAREPEPESDMEQERRLRG
jgi:outer membrane biosynthesis protein TonB